MSDSGYVMRTGNIPPGDYPLNDDDFKDEVITAVEQSSMFGDGYGVSCNGWVLYMDGNCGIVPEVGQVRRTYPGGIGRSIRGLFINGKKVYYQTEAEQKEKHRLEELERECKRQEELEANLPEYNRRIAELPDVFQQRFVRFRAGSAIFDRDFLSYELFCCEQAVALAKHFLAKSVSGETASERIKEFKELTYEEQIAECPFMDAGHSGNTFSCSVLLAYYYTRDPQVVPKLHGALTPLVGCEEYGCVHAEDTESNPGDNP